MGFSLCGIPVGRGYVKTLRIFGVEDSTWPGRVVDTIPTAPTSLLILYKGLAKSARQQKAAIRAKSVGQWQMRLAVRMASRRINPCTRATCPNCSQKVAANSWAGTFGGADDVTRVTGQKVASNNFKSAARVRP